MSQHHNNKFSNPILSLFRSIRIAFQRMTRRTMRSLLRVWMRINRQDRYGRAGFVLPTVVMVLLVVVLLTITIMLRSMDRAKMAQYRRVDEQVLQAATPALDRAKAKIERLLELAETEQPRPLGTPDDDKLDTIIGGDDFTFGGEKRLKVQFGTNEITTAWRFETDTNNDGYPDTYNLYGIFYHQPVSDKERTPLDARTLPMAEIGSDIDPECAQVLGMGKDAKSLAGKWNWESRGGKVKKSFFVYTTTAPMSTQGAPGTSALEYEQDVIRISLNNNAVLYDGTVEVAPSPEFRLNGRIVANGNLMVTPTGNPVKPLKFYLVSGENSCFYNDPQNSKIIIGGNVFNGTIEKDINSPPYPVTDPSVALDLYKGKTGQGSTTIDQTNESVSDAFDKVGHNDNAYEQRIAQLISAWKTLNPTADDNTFSPKDPSTLVRSFGRDKALEIYFRDRTRRVPFAEVAEGGDPFVNVPDPIFGEGDQLRPDNRWARPHSSLTDNAFEEFTKLNRNKNQLLAVKPSDDNTEYLIGDRVKAGNNLPALLLDNTKFITAKQTFGVWSDDKGTATEEPRERQTQVTPLPGVGAVDRDGFWEGAAAQLPQSKDEGFGGLRVITGAGVYDPTLSFLPPPTWNDPATTGDESLYDDPATTTVTEQYPVVWPDTMPMSPAIGMKPYDRPNSQWSATTLTALPTANAQFARGDLRMRATAVYHYADNGVADSEKASPGRQTPIACVSSYYDSTDSNTAKNINTLPWNNDAKGRSNNGIVYPPPTPTVTAALGATGLFTGGTDLEKQANYVFPDGRFANEPLRDALEAVAGGKTLATLTLAQQSAIDSTQCALDIISASPPTPSATVIPHGAIREASLLDARQIKAITLDNASTKVDETFTLSSPLTETEKANLGDTPKYDLPLEQRQPLELRVTVLDLDQLRKTAFGKTSAKGPTGEYLLPLSGIIYASRDDALPDWSNREEGTGGKIDEIKRNLISRTDFKLDPSRSPDGIMLINGPNLARKDNAGTQNQKIERGLTLATNLPVYIQGDFNLHTQEEFTSANKLADDWANFYGRTGRNKAFACTTIDNSNCTSPGDEWRPVTILADAISVLSDNFRLGYRNEGDFDLRSNASGAIAFAADTATYDLNADGDTDDSVTEDSLKLDLNGDGDTGDTIAEKQVTAKMVRLINGFYENNFVTNGLSSGGFAFNKTAAKDLGIRVGTKTGTEVQLDDNYYKSGYSDTDKNANSSYFNNFVTPIQRRGTFPEYLMEVCLKPMASACGPDDWRVAVDSNGDKVVQDTELKEASKAIGATVGNLLFGTTALPVVDPDYQRYPRRVAFARYTTAGTNKDKLYLDDTKLPVALGINTTVGCYSYSSGASDPIVNLPITVNGGASPTACTKGFPPAKANALWFRTTTATTSTTIPSLVSNDWKYSIGTGSPSPNRLYYRTELVTTGTNTGTYQQPLLVPVLQIYATDNSPQAGEPTGAKLATELRWMPRAKSTTFNMVMAVGDIPARPGETNGGLQNLPRLQENWQGTSNQNQKMMGSFMQLFRSAYATAPYLPVRNPVDNASFFGYTATRYRGAGGGRTPYQGPPTRQWGFDVGLLSQYPDLFSSLFTTPIKSETGERKDATEEYFRQVSRDDEWVKGLLCAKLGAGGNAVTVGRPADCTAYGG